MRRLLVEEGADGRVEPCQEFEGGVRGCGQEERGSERLLSVRVQALQATRAEPQLACRWRVTTRGRSGPRKNASPSPAAAWHQ